MYTKKELSTTTKIRLALIFVIIVFVIGFIAYQYLQYESKTLRNQKYEELRIIAEAKHNQIVNWRSERLSDATMTTKSSFILEALKQYLNNERDVNVKEELIERLNLLKTTYQYEEVFITTVDKTPILFNTSNIPKIDSTLSSNITNAIEQRRIIFSDFYSQLPNNSIKLDIVAPFLNSDSIPIAVLVLRINPHTYLYPLIQSWPTTSKTSETVLVRRDSASIIFLNELRHKKGGALTVKILLTRTDAPGVQAVLGQKGVYEGIDYRNIPVISDIRPIEETPWFMVTKTDKSEVFTDLEFKITILVIIVCILSLLVAVIIAWFYHYRQQHIYKQLFYSEKNLHETENEYRTIIYSIGDAVITVNQTGSIKHMNQQAEILTGWSEIEAKGQPINSVANITYENSNKPFTFPLGENSNINTNNFDGIKTTIESREGTITPISISVSPIISNKTNYQGAILIFHDQTVERKAEKELMESKERLAFALDGANDGLWDVEMDSGKVYLSPRACEILGYTTENIHNSYNKWTDLIHPQDLPAMQEALSDYFKGYANFFSIEQRLRTKQGDYKWILTRGKIVMNTDYSKPTRMVGTYTDISNRKSAEIQLREQERLIRETSQLAKIGGWEIEIETMNGFWSEEAAKIFDLPGKVYLTVEEGINLFKSESRQTILAVIREAIEQQKLFDVEFEIETVNKNTKWVRSIGGPVIENGKVVKVRGTYQDITDRKKAEMEREAIIEQYLEVARETENSRNKLNAVFNAVSDGIAVSDITGNFFLVNKAQALINGFSSVEEMQKNLEYFASVYELRTVDGDCVPIEDWPISKVLKGESVRDYELHGYRTDTKREWYFSFSGEPVFDEQGKQILAVIVTRDITKQMQTAIALKQQQDELQLLLTISQAVSESTTFEAALQQTLELVCKTTRWDIGEAWIPSFENKNLVYSNAWYCIYDQLKPFKDISHPYTFAKGTGLPGRVWMQKEPIWIRDLQQDDSFLRKTATATFGLTSAVGIPILSQGEVISVMVFFITAPKQNEEQYVMLFSNIAIQLGQLFQRKKAEEALHESEERLRLSLTAAKQGLYDLNLITGETVVNKEYANMLGYAVESFVETNEFWQERLHPDDKARTAQIYYDYISGLIPVYNVEFRQRTKDGKWKWILSLGKIVEYDSDNRPTRMLGTHTDITDRKVAEQEILILNELLEQKVVERTRQLEAANKELEAFSYSVSHDLKAPLRHINGFVNLLAKSYKETLPQEGKRYLNTIETAAQQMGTLIDDLLKLSRTSRMEMIKKTVSMDKIVNNALNLVLRTPPNHKIKWIISPLPDAFCDANLLQMVWSNLIENAVKYTQNNSKSTIEIGALDNQLGTVYFIRDNGVGFDMKYADKLFGVFQRLHTEHEFEGTGIGLANVNRIITRHGGKLWAEAELNKGACFYFIIPPR